MTTCVRVPVTSMTGFGSQQPPASHCSLMREELQAAHTNTVSLWASGAKNKTDKENVHRIKKRLFIRVGVIFLPHLSPPCMISALCRNSIVNRSCYHSYCSFSAAQRHCVKTSSRKQKNGRGSLKPYPFL